MFCRIYLKLNFDFYYLFSYFKQNCTHSSELYLFPFIVINFHFSKPLENQTFDFNIVPRIIFERLPCKNIF